MKSPERQEFERRKEFELKMEEADRGSFLWQRQQLAIAWLVFWWTFLDEIEKKVRPFIEWTTREIHKLMGSRG